MPDLPLNILPWVAVISIILGVSLKIYSILAKKKRSEEIIGRILDKKRPVSKAEAEEYEKVVARVGPVNRVVSGWGTYLLFMYYINDYAGDRGMIQRALDCGETIKNEYGDMPFYGDAVFDLGNVYFFTAFDFKTAASVYRRLIVERPETRWLVICLDRIELIENNIFNEEALKLYVTAEKYFENSEYRKAQELLTEVIENHPATGLTASALYFLGDIFYYKYSDLENALIYYRKTVDGFHRHSSARMSLYKFGEILMKLERWEEAVAAFREYIEKYSESPFKDDAYYFIGECFQNLGRYRDAKNAFSLLLGDFPESKWTEVIYHKVQELNKLLQEKKAT